MSITATTLWALRLPTKYPDNGGEKKKNQASRGRVMITVSGFFLAQNLIASKMGDQRICNYREKKKCPGAIDYAWR